MSICNGSRSRWKCNKKRCRHNIAYPLGYGFITEVSPFPFVGKSDILCFWNFWWCGISRKIFGTWVWSVVAWTVVILFSQGLLWQKQPPRGVLKKSVLKICSNFTGEHPCWSVISVKLQSNFIEIAIRHGCSPVNLLHIFRTPFPRNTSGWLLLFWYMFIKRKKIRPQ